MDGKVKFFDGFVEERLVDEYLLAADVVVLNYRSQYFEASGALARAIGAGAAIVTSTAPPFARFGDSVFHVTSGFPLGTALRLVLNDSKLNAALREKSRRWSERYSWSEIAATWKREYHSLLASKASRRTSASSSSSEALKILMQNRENAFSQRGGDTVVMEMLASELRKLGHQVDIDLEGRKQPSDYDLAHLYNFATPEITKRFAERCVAQGTPYVVTTMYEDLPVFYNQMLAYFRALEAYVVNGQPAEHWPELAKAAASVTPAPRWENAWVAEHAEALITTGPREKACIESDYPNAKLVETYSCGCDLLPLEGAEAFVKEYGIEDFILCVGRLETRKNQLMLLKAFERSDLPIVFATGGFTYQPNYESACKNFKRPGRTVFLDRLDEKLLASAYSAARVHALPSWFELPGIVSMEAARRGTNIVVSDYGTARDYFGDRAFYCAPSDPQSIYNAVMAAYHAPATDDLSQALSECTWKNAASKTLEVYTKVVSVSEQSAPVSGRGEISVSLDNARERVDEAGERVSEVGLHYGDSGTADRQVSRENNKADLADMLCDQAESCLASGLSDDAKRLFCEAREIIPGYAKACRGLGAVDLVCERYTEAEARFKEALSIDEKDVKARVGLGAALWGARTKGRSISNLCRCNSKQSPGANGFALFSGKCLFFESHR